jgi:cephalosporin hydroxylase
MRDLSVTPLSGQQILDGIRADKAKHRDVIDAFHSAFWLSKFTHNLTNWMGRPILKNPLDLWIYQEILHDLQPDLIIETGTAFGGSALFFAHMMDRRGKGKIVSIDIEPHEPLPTHPRCLFMRGSSVDPIIVSHVTAMAKGYERVMVILDSDHSKAHVLAELDVYAPLVTPGQFLVVEDTNINGRPVPFEWYDGPGPGPAVDEWLPNHPEFAPDEMAERFMMTFYPGGWLRRQP